MDKHWLLSDANTRLSEVINMALISPQSIKCQNETVIILSQTEYNRLLGQQGFKAHLLSPPCNIEDLDLSRDNNMMRDIEL